MLIERVYNQAVYPGAGDVDDCWIVAANQAARASAPFAERQSVTRFRRFAGDPDDGVRDGGTLEEILAGCRGAWPWLAVRGLARSSWRSLELALTTGDPRPATVAVTSGLLPTTYGFRGAHEVTVFVELGWWWIANPLAPEGSRPVRISVDALRAAALDLGRGTVRAAIFPTRAEARAAAITAGVLMEDEMIRTTTRELPFGGTWRAQPGDVVQVVDASTLELLEVKTFGAETGAAFDAVVTIDRTPNARPEGTYIRVTSGLYAGRLLSAAPLERTVNTASGPILAALERARAAAIAAVGVAVDQVADSV